ncbi:MAG: GDP-mannose 4,6-dehydratase [Bdellovibrionaceae bacterium]|nr:GDP-mannose 4,6-dehydratase [Bdellovibrio sp.]
MPNDLVFVIGSNSFSGAYFVNSALNGGFKVIGTSRSLEPHEVFLPYRKNKNFSNFSFYQLDLNSDMKRLQSLIAEVKPSYVVNFAAQSMVAQSWENPEHWFQTNTLSNVTLHNFLRKCDFIKRYIHISTPEVYGSCNSDIDETAPFNPTTPYAVSRAAADMSLLSFYKAYNFPVIFTRAANVYGPGQQLYRIIPKTILSILKGTKLPLHGGGSSVRSFIHIDDVCRGTLQLLTKGHNGHAYHFSTKDQISIKQLVEQICLLMDKKFEDVAEVVGERLGKDSAYLLDSTKAKTDLNWKPEISFAQGLDETIRWVEENYNELKKLPWDYIHQI